jgi:hypothetical protein
LTLQVEKTAVEKWEGIIENRTTRTICNLLAFGAHVDGLINTQNPPSRVSRANEP